MPLFNWAASTEARPSRQGDGLAHLGLLAHHSENKGALSPFPPMASSAILAGRRRVAAEGGVGALAQNLQSLLRPIGWRGAH
jgi:hypothetical protein